jgi:hypothetical protein
MDIRRRPVEDIRHITREPRQWPRSRRRDSTHRRRVDMLRTLDPNAWILDRGRPLNTQTPET